MMSVISTIGISGVEGYPIEVEVKLLSGMANGIELFGFDTVEAWLIGLKKDNIISNPNFRRHSISKEFTRF